MSRVCDGAPSSRLEVLMKPLLWIAGAFLLLGGNVRAQDDSLEKIQKDLDKLMQAKVAPTPAQFAEIADRCMNVATDLKGQPQALDAYMMAIDLTGQLEKEKQATVFSEAMDAVVESHLDDDRIAMLVMRSLSFPPEPLKTKAKEYLDWIGRDSKSPSVQCAIAFKAVSQRAASAIDAASCKPVVADIEALKKKYGAVKSPWNQTWGQLLDEQLDSLKVVGTPAKEIAANDLDGVAFKLSDYRGKTVLLDFWGYW